jgi:integrase
MIKDLIRAALATGAREDELLRAQRPDIDDTRRQMTLVGKRNKRRTIDLEPFGGYDLIRSLPSHINSQLVFWHSDGESYKNFASQFAAIVGRTAAWAKAEGIDFRPFRFHDLRHWHAVHWAKVGPFALRPTATARSFLDQGHGGLSSLRLSHVRGIGGGQGGSAGATRHKSRHNEFAPARGQCEVMPLAVGFL